MSADAKAWTEPDGSWAGTHDGPCCDHMAPQTGGPGHGTESHGPYDLTVLLQGIERCMERELRWEFRTYPDGKVGLVGYYA